MNEKSNVLIISTANDKSTDDVILYLKYYNCNYFRINFKDQVDFYLKFSEFKNHAELINHVFENPFNNYLRSFIKI